MNAEYKWLQLFMDIVAYEINHTSDGQLLSEGADRLVDKHPIAGRVFIVAAGAIITLHLANLVDERYDLMNKHIWRTVGTTVLRPGSFPYPRPIATA